jgi:hypothetical protein
MQTPRAPHIALKREEPVGRLVYAGRVGTGISQAELGRLWRRLQPLATDEMPLQVAITSTNMRCPSRRASDFPPGDRSHAPGIARVRLSGRVFVLTRLENLFESVD